ncbi:MAG: hypothetical protein EA340_00220 [Nitriliruptor sp.]|nr:MAG: hypothetical protein EA340_00220 [Nitriliruptor sp.]
MTDGYEEIPHEDEAHQEPTSVGPLGADGARGARILAGAVLGLGLLLAVAALARPALNVAMDQTVVPVTVEEPEAILTDDPEGLPPDSRIELARAGSVELVVTGLPAWLRALTGLGTAVGGVLLGVGAWLVRSMLLLVASGRAFDRRMPGRLRGLALVVLAGSVFPPAFDGLAATFAVNTLGGLPDGGPLGIQLFELQLLTVLVVVLLGIAAQVFESGRRLTEELEGLV